MTARGLLVSGLGLGFLLGGCGGGDRGGGASTSGSGGTAVTGAGGGAGTEVSGAGGDSAGGSAGATDAGDTITTGGDAGAASDGAAGTGGGVLGCAAARLCDSFEGAAPGAAGSDWKTEIQGATVEVVADKAHTGTHSVHVKVPATTTIWGYIAETKTFPAMNNDFWGRVFIWSEVGTQTAHVVNVAADGAKVGGGGNDEVRVSGTQGNKLVTNLQSTDKSYGSSVMLPQGKWSCYEWHLQPNDLKLYLDGAEVKGTEATWASPTVNKLRIGFQRWEAGPVGDMWIDDVAVNDTQIGCQ
jgi:hypothetical protein